MVRDFSGQVVVITGATGTLGQAAANAYLQTGAQLVLVGRDKAKLEDRFPELTGRPDHLLAAPVDLTDADSVAGLSDQVRERFGRVDVLLNLVGAFRSGTPVHELDPGAWDMMLAVNARSAFLSLRAVLPLMLDQGHGRIINVGARPGQRGRAKMAPYAASKAAVIRLTESVAQEVKQAGINVNCVIPGTIDTPANRASMPEADVSAWVAPEAIVDVMLFLTSDEARAIHGACIPVYGLS